MFYLLLVFYVNSLHIEKLPPYNIVLSNVKTTQKILHPNNTMETDDGNPHVSPCIHFPMPVQHTSERKRNTESDPWVENLSITTRCSNKKTSQCCCGYAVGIWEQQTAEATTRAANRAGGKFQHNVCSQHVHMTCTLLMRLPALEWYTDMK